MKPNDSVEKDSVSNEFEKQLELYDKIDEIDVDPKLIENGK